MVTKRVAMYCMESTFSPILDLISSGFTDATTVATAVVSDGIVGLVTRDFYHCIEESADCWDLSWLHVPI